jgi:hypothetical protein
MTLKSSHTILNYFNELLEFNKLSFLRDRAIEEISNQYSGFIDSVDLDKGIVKYNKVFYNPRTDDSIEGLVTYDFYKEHKLEILEKSKDVIKSLDQLIYLKSEQNEHFKSLLDNISKELFFLQLKTEKLYPNYPELSVALQAIETHLLTRYQIQPFALKKIDEKLSYFGFRDTLSRQVFQDIYELLDSLGYIEFDVVDEKTFLEVFLENPLDSASVIHFNCSNGIVITLLEKLRPFFTSLTPKTIEKSKRFLTKQGMVLSESNYNTSNKRLKEKSSQKIDKLNQELNAILKE